MPAPRQHSASAGRPSVEAQPARLGFAPQKPQERARRRIEINAADELPLAGVKPVIDRECQLVGECVEPAVVLVEFGYAQRQRNTARWVIALALGLRQGEVLGLKWDDVDFEAGVIRVRRGRLRPRYKHGCGDRCGRKPGYCPQRVSVRRETKNTKSRAGKRPIGVPSELMKLLKRHREEQARECALARDLWVEKGYVFTSPTGEPLNPNTDYHRWKDLLKAAGVRDGRLHDARHTAATVLLILGVPDAIVDAIMGWEPGKSARMRRRYQHLTGPVLRDTADKVGELLWADTSSTSPRQ